MPYAVEDLRAPAWNCGRRSSGMSGRCALYSGTAAKRSAGMPASKQATMWVGFSSASTRCEHALETVRGVDRLAARRGERRQREERAVDERVDVDEQQLVSGHMGVRSTGPTRRCQRRDAARAGTWAVRRSTHKRLPRRRPATTKPRSTRTRRRSCRATRRPIPPGRSTTR